MGSVSAQPANTGRECVYFYISKGERNEGGQRLKKESQKEREINVDTPHPSEHSSLGLDVL